MSDTTRKYRIEFGPRAVRPDDHKEFSDIDSITIDKWGHIKVIKYGLVIDQIEPDDWEVIFNHD